MTHYAHEDASESDGPSRAEDQFVRLFSKSQCVLHAYILGLTRSAADADDILQEVNLALWRKRDQYDLRSNFLTWALGFARVEISNFRRKTAKGRLLFSDDVLNLLASDWPADVGVYEQRLSALAACLQRLREDDRAYVAAFYRQETSVRELAAATGVSASSIYKILHRARESLRRCVKSRVAQSLHPS